MTPSHFVVHRPAVAAEILQAEAADILTRPGLFSKM
jgi:hypothetical protein